MASLVGNSPIPTAHDGISEINDVVLKSIALRDAAVNAGLANGANYHLLYYRCASLAYAYIPNVQDWEQEHLAFPIHSWWLPDTFEMATIASAIQDTSSTPKEKPDHIFKAAINAGRFTMFPKSTGYDGGQFASSSEYNATTIIATRFFLNNSYTNGQAASGYGIPYKHLSFLMRFANNF